ncbi:MAG: hypothetical protein KGY99_11130, partial [Phycisphaerae bacterium]|nr:hypothetical protein [Phycisphaerae bacterium]
QDGRTTVSLPGWVRDALAAQSTHRDVVSYVSQHVDPQQEFCGLPPDRDEIVQRIAPWYAAVWRDLAASNGRALLEHLARMLADWPEQQRDLRELAPLVQAMYRAWSAFRAAGVERTPAFRAVGWDIVRWHQVTGVPKPRGLRRHATITSPEARAEHRLATRHGRDAAAQLKQQHGSAAVAERQQPRR